jgi:hypothetical protein
MEVSESMAELPPDESGAPASGEVLPPVDYVPTIPLPQPAQPEDEAAPPSPAPPPVPSFEEGEQGDGDSENLQLLNFALWADGEDRGGVSVVHASQLPAPPPGAEWRPLRGDACSFALALVDGALVEVPLRSLMAAAPQLELARTERWAAAKVYRDARMQAGCPTAKGVVDTNEDSQRKINGAATAALIAKVGGADWSIEWTMADNSVVPHDADEMIALGVSVAAHIAACQNAGTAVRTAIEAADTPQAVDQIDITAGYPTAA